MIDISFKFYLQKSHDIYILHQFTWGHNRPPKKNCRECRELSSSSFIPHKNKRELLTLVVFAVKSLTKLLLVLMKKSVELLDELQDTQNIKRYKAK